jgi:hypothetical protein
LSEQTPKVNFPLLLVGAFLQTGFDTILLRNWYQVLRELLFFFFGQKFSAQHYVLTNIELSLAACVVHVPDLAENFALSPTLIVYASYNTIACIKYMY